MKIKSNISGKTYDFEPNQFKPRRRWIAGFSHKPNYLLFFITACFICLVIALFGYLINRALLIGDRARGIDYTPIAIKK